jgi:hypothetical protein
MLVSCSMGHFTRISMELTLPQADQFRSEFNPRSTLTPEEGVEASSQVQQYLERVICEIDLHFRAPADIAFGPRQGQRSTCLPKGQR